MKYDLIVIGAGGAGMMAALTMAKAGKSVLVLERGKSLSTSNAARAGGPSLAGTELEKREGLDVSPEFWYRRFYGFARGTVDAGLLYRCAKNGRKVEEFFDESGVGLRLSEDLYHVGFRARHMFAMRAPERWKRLGALLEGYGGRILLGARATSLVMEDGRTAGVRAETGGEETVYHGNNILVATGGYLGNPGMLKEHFGDVNVGVLGNKLSDGSGIRMVLEAGGVLERNWGICAGEFGGWHSRMRRPFPGNMRWAMTGGLLVNREGRRFANEQMVADEPLSVGGEILLRAGAYFAVADSDFYEGVRAAQSLYDFYGRPDAWEVGKCAHSRGPWPFREDLETDLSEGWAYRCDSLAGAAGHFGLPHLTETVETYNRMCQAGEDTEFLKSPWLLRPVKKAPFYIFAYEPSAWCTLGGVKTDGFCRALDAGQEPIPGLYVAGVDNGSAYCAPYYDVEGACLGLAFTAGIVAAEHMLGE